LKKKKNRVRAKRRGSKVILNPKRKFSADYILATLIKLEIDDQEVARAAPITPILKEAEGGLPAVLDAMRFSQDPIIVKFLKAYDLGNEIDHHILGWEAWAVKARVDIPSLLGSILIALRLQAVNTIKIVSITTHPDVVRATVKNAMTPKGFRDRETLHQALGFLPRAKGATFIDKYFAGTVGGSMPEDDETPTPDKPADVLPARPDEIDIDDLFPNVEDTQLMLGDGN
jgi:hypothetical protein